MKRRKVIYQRAAFVLVSTRLLNEMLHFFSEEILIVPEAMHTFPLVQHALSDTALIKGPNLLHE